MNAPAPTPTASASKTTESEAIRDELPKYVVDGLAQRLDTGDRYYRNQHGQQAVFEQVLTFVTLDESIDDG
jgi:hypothetical protein